MSEGVTLRDRSFTQRHLGSRQWTLIETLDHFIPSIDRFTKRSPAPKETTCHDAYLSRRHNCRLLEGHKGLGKKASVNGCSSLHCHSGLGEHDSLECGSSSKIDCACNHPHDVLRECSTNKNDLLGCGKVKRTSDLEDPSYEAEREESESLRYHMEERYVLSVAVPEMVTLFPIETPVVHL